MYNHVCTCNLARIFFVCRMQITFGTESCTFDPCVKKDATAILLITLPNADTFSELFAKRLSGKFVIIKSLLVILLCHECATTLPCEIFGFFLIHSGLSLFEPPCSYAENWNYN